MIKKIIFAGCSVTAGNELWEEAHIPNYASMGFNEARKVMEKVSNKQEIEDYNRSHAYPELVGRALGVESVNLGISGISNKEIAGRIIAQFTEDRYDGVVVFIQLTTHNRMFLKYKEDSKGYTAGSFVVMAKGEDSRLTRSQNNLLKEMFFEFLPDWILTMDDHVYMYYAVELLRSKGIHAYIVWPSLTIVDWANFTPGEGFNVVKPIPMHNDKDPQYIDRFSHHCIDKAGKYNAFEGTTTMLDLTGPGASLPRFHPTQHAHQIIANNLVERIKCLTS